MSIKRILVPLPGSASHTGQIETALSAAKALGAHVRALFISQPPPVTRSDVAPGGPTVTEMGRTVTVPSIDWHAEERERTARDAREVFAQACAVVGIPMRALAVTTATRSQALPNVPTMSELLPGFEASGWIGIGAPSGTPPEIIDKLNREINAGLANPTINERIADLGGEVFVSSPADFAKFVAEETEAWTKVVRAGQHQGRVNC